MPAQDIQDMVNSATRTARVYYFESMAALPQERFMQATMPATSNAASHDYSWLGDIPAVQEWLDERSLNELRAHSFHIINRRWEDTVQVPLMAFRTNNLGLIKTRVADLVDAGKRHIFKMMSDLLVGGTAATCFDGQNFFSNTHSFADSGTFDNLLGGAGTAIANIKTDWAAAKAAMRAFPNGNAEPINRVPNMVWCPPELEAVFLEFATATMIASTTNVYTGSFVLVVDPYLTDADDWYAICTDAPMKPIIHQVNQPWEFKSVTNLNDSWVFMNDKVLYGGDGYYNMGYGLPHLAAKVVN